ncbi:MAG: sigma-70 family RNA polymerase sigma factor [Saprospiraceae bacterium]|nr:sigma-70 family RNA polymerase sigma factor [Saprospiraceae bacterium]MBK9568317.1 sigma-70 family RNA polymerase sigma factor [Saprospiraceae bacterium]MBP6445289.1 sigma-70 family RNA polymerase sigma factor [Saprospiraceae bacterium]
MSDQLEHIINNCKKEDPEAQKKLYDMFKDQMFAVCLRYLKNHQDAEDIFIEGFFKVLTKIGNYKGDGSFEGWMRKVMVNESLMFLRKRTNLHMTVEIPEKDIADEILRDEDEISAEDIIKILDELPVGYRTVFNLYVFEDYKHREIAEMLGISINTSKSQLILAKKRVHEILKKKENSINKLKF